MKLPKFYIETNVHAISVKFNGIPYLRLSKISETNYFYSWYKWEEQGYICLEKDRKPTKEGKALERHYQDYLLEE